MLSGVEWGEYRIGDLFEVKGTLSFNKEALVSGDEYDYVTRTSQNQGILQTTAFVNKENLNEAGTWSLGLLQMDFFYRQRQWYAGQFVRKVVFKGSLPNGSISFFTTVLNALKPKLLSVLVRDVNKTFLDSYVQLPTRDGKIDFMFMERFVAELKAQRVAELKAQRVAELKAYLAVTGLSDYTLTPEEQQAIQHFQEDNLQWRDYRLTSVFEVKNAGNILSSEVVAGSGSTPYLCASRENNAVSSYVSYKDEMLSEGNCIFIGGKTFVVTYQEKDFFSNDSHNLILRLYEAEHRTKHKQLYLTTCIDKSLRHRYSWGDSISNKKIQTDKVTLPTSSDKPDYTQMETFIRAIEKLVIRDVVLYADRELAATQQVINQ